MSAATQWAKSKAGPEFNEFYTLYEEAAKFLTPYLEYINKANIIYCPCDSEESNIVKWLKNNCNANILHQHEKDFNSEEIRSDMLKADIIITNPPFQAKHFNPFVEWLLANNKDFILWTPNNSKFFNEVYYFDFHRSNTHPYLTPKGEIKYAMSKVMSTFRVLHNFKPNKEYDLSYMPYTATWYFNKDDYIYLGRVKQRDPKDYARVAISTKEVLL